MNQYHLWYYVLQQKKKIPRFSNAEIKNKFIKNNSGILNLILENPTDNTYKRVRILLRNNSKESGNLIIQDSDFNKVKRLINNPGGIQNPPGFFPNKDYVKESKSKFQYYCRNTME